MEKNGIFTTSRISEIDFTKKLTIKCLIFYTVHFQLFVYKIMGKMCLIKERWLGREHFFSSSSWPTTAS